MVAIKKDTGRLYKGYLPHRIFVFLRLGSSITCRVMGYWRYSSGLPQGGLKEPCVLDFEGGSKD